MRSTCATPARLDGPVEPLSRAVRRALRLGAGVTLTALALSASAETFPGLFPLRSLYTGGGIEGFALSGVQPRQFDRDAVNGAGDINADGVDDLVLGSLRGNSYVVFGNTAGFPEIFDLATLPNGDGTAGFALQQVDASTPAVSGAGDVNGDGIDDLVIGFGYGLVNSGISYVVFGRDGGGGGQFPAVFPLGNLLPGSGGDGSEGFALLGGEGCTLAGSSVSAAGDVNGDAIDDLIIGGQGAVWPFCYYGVFDGHGYIVFGRDTQRDGNFPAAFDLTSLFPENGGDGTAGVHLVGPGNSYAGNSVSGGGDVNGDGIDDVVVGGWFSTPHFDYGVGESFVVFGRDVAQDGGFPAEIDLEDLYPENGGDASIGFVVRGSDAFDRTGYSVSIAGDLDGNGIDDVLIGALDVEEIYVVFGRDTAQQGRFPALFPVGGLHPPLGDGSAGFVMNGANFIRDRTAVSGAGDLNGDGMADLIVGARNAMIGRNRPGGGFVVFGRDTAQSGDFPALFPLKALLPPFGDGSTGFVAKGVRDDDDTGISVGDAGDVNADGIDDVIIASKRDAFVVYGRDYRP